jgi:hypothetical protein
MKHLVMGLAGLLMLALNIIYFYSNNNPALHSCYAAGQSTDFTISQIGCSHNCSACGRCFTISENDTLETRYADTTIAAYKLSYK